MITLEQVIQIGMATIRVDKYRIDTNSRLHSTGYRTWVASYGVHPTVAFQVWTMIKERCQTLGCSLVHLFWLLYWFKTYDTDENISRILKVSKPTLSKYRLKMLPLLSSIMPRIVSFCFLVIDFFLILNKIIF